MEDKKTSGSVPNSQEMKIQVQGNQSESTGYSIPPSGFQAFTYSDLLYYLDNDQREAKLLNYMQAGGAHNMSNQYCSICNKPGHDNTVCLRPSVPDWPGIPINGIGVLERPLWIPALYHPKP